MKNLLSYLLTGFVAMSFFACQKSSDLVSSTNTPPPAGAYIKSAHLKGTLKGSLKQDSTYYLDGDMIVNPKDSFGISQGAKILATGNYRIEIAGTLISNGTEAKPVTISVKDPSTAYANLGDKGYWGGILVDSTAKYVSIKFTHINYTGGPDATGSAQASFDVEGSQSYDGGAKIIFEDNWMFGGIDDGVHLAGNITCSLKRNVMQRLGGPDGDLFNIKAGAHGDIAYNYIWSSSNSGIKLGTGKTVLTPQTKWNIYNNTIVNGNWRKVGELSSAILVDQFAAANIYNNVIVGCRNGINITTKADVNNCKYSNNLLYMYDAKVDSFTNMPYVTGSAGIAQSSDKIAAGLTACGTVFTNWDKDVTVCLVDNTIPSLKAGSPAIGTGTTSASVPFYSVGSAMPLNRDMGAYPTDGTGNKHLPTTKPVQ